MVGRFAAMVAICAAVSVGLLAGSILAMMVGEGFGGLFRSDGEWKPSDALVQPLMASQ